VLKEKIARMREEAQRLKMLLLKMWQKHHPIKLGPKEEKMLMQDVILIGKHISLLSSNTKPCFNLTSAVTAKFQLFILLFDVERALNIYYCPDCDWAYHFKKPFHDRKLFEESSSRPILPYSECILSNGQVIEKGNNQFIVLC
jgi:hypothetical protein